MVEKSEKCLEKKVIFCILSFLSFTVFSNSEPLSPLYLIYGNSQVFYTHCSLIPYQDFFPSSCDLQFNTFEKNYTIRYSSVFSFKNNGFAIGYKRDGKNMNVISTGFGVKKENVGFGSSLNVFLKRNDPLLNLNVSSSLHLNTIIDNILLSINNISLIQEEKLAPDILLDITGKFFKPMNLYYDFSLFSNIKLKDIKKSPLNVKYDITGKAGNKSCFMYSAGYQINFVHNSISNLLNFSLGSISSIAQKSVGLHLGYTLDLNKEANSIQCNLSFNPFHYEDVTPPVVSMNVTCSENKNPGYYFSLKSDDNNESGLNSWTLVISDQPSKNGKIVRMFSGGFPMPSTVFWDKKNCRGEYSDTLKVFSRLVVIDRSKNIGYTSWIPLNACRE